MAQTISFNPLTTDFRKMKMPKEFIDKVLDRVKFLGDEIPRRLSLYDKLKEIRAPKSVLASERRCIRRYTKEYEGYKPLLAEYDRRCKAFLNMIFGKS